MSGPGNVFTCPGAIGALVHPGMGPSQAAVKCGDAILLDMGQRIFAISDSAPRSPGASIKLLGGLRAMVRDWPELQGCTQAPAGAALVLLEELKERVQQTMTMVTPFESCTLTGLAVIRTTDGLRGLMFHTGDSLLFKYVPNYGLFQVSRTNFWMVGRSRQLFQTEVLEIPRGTVFILATDGLMDMIYRKRLGLKVLDELMAQGSLESLPARFMTRCGLSGENTDDLGLLALEPHCLPPCDWGGVLGYPDAGPTCHCPEQTKLGLKV